MCSRHTHLLHHTSALQQLDGHPNIVKLHDVVAQEEGGPGLTLVFEYMSSDLGKVLNFVRQQQKHLKENQVERTLEAKNLLWFFYRSRVSC
jgi:hypothetical protein